MVNRIEVKADTIDVCTAQQSCVTCHHEVASSAHSYSWSCVRKRQEASMHLLSFRALNKRRMDMLVLGVIYRADMPHWP
jgi:hypothetical protein